MTVAKCPICDRQFIQKTLRHQLCSDNCRKESKKTKYLGNGMTVKGNKFSIKGADNILMFLVGR